LGLEFFVAGCKFRVDDFRLKGTEIRVVVQGVGVGSGVEGVESGIEK